MERRGFILLLPFLFLSLSSPSSNLTKFDIRRSRTCYMLHVTYISNSIKIINRPPIRIRPSLYLPPRLPKVKISNFQVIYSLHLRKVWKKSTEMVYIVPFETCSRGHRAEGYCNYDLSFGSWVLFSLFASLVLKSLVGGMGWDGMAKV